MLYLIEGVPGSGKSYWLTARIVNWIDEGKKIYTNLAINPEAIAEHIAKLTAKKEKEQQEIKERILTEQIHILKDEEIKRIWELDLKDCIIVIDEIHSYFLSRNTLNLPEELTHWISKHRHSNIDIYAASQNIKNVDVQFRRNAQGTWKLRKSYEINIFPSSKLFGGIRWPFLFFRGEYTPDGQRKPTDKIDFWAKKKIFKLYDSYTYGGGEHKKTSAIKQLADNIYCNPVPFVVLFLTGVLILSAPRWYQKSIDYLTGADNTPTKKKEEIQREKDQDEQTDQNDDNDKINLSTTQEIAKDNHEWITENLLMILGKKVYFKDGNSINIGETFSPVSLSAVSLLDVTEAQKAKLLISMKDPDKSTELKLIEITF